MINRRGLGHSFIDVWMIWFGHPSNFQPNAKRMQGLGTCEIFDDLIWILIKFEISVSVWISWRSNNKKKRLTEAENFRSSCLCSRWPETPKNVVKEEKAGLFFFFFFRKFPCFRLGARLQRWKWRNLCMTRRQNWITPSHVSSIIANRHGNAPSRNLSTWSQARWISVYDLKLMWLLKPRISWYVNCLAFV